MQAPYAPVTPGPPCRGLRSRPAAAAAAQPLPPFCSLPSAAGLSSLTWLLPDRFAEGELTIEALHTALGLLSSFHDSIASSPPGAPPLPGGDLLLALSTLEQIQVSLIRVAELLGIWP